MKRKRDRSESGHLRRKINSWTRFLSKEGDWDYSFMIEMEYMKLWQMEEYFKERDTFVGIEYVRRDLKICLRLLDIVLEKDDFNIELIRTDKINVVYILNLLKDVIKKDENEKKRSIDLILREIERSDNERLRAKQDMLKRFVTEKFFNLSPDEDIVKAYEEFEVLQQNMDIEMFAEETNLDVETIRFFISEYQFKHVISLEDIRKRLSQKGYGLLQTIKLSSEIEEFVKEQYEKFRAEGV